VFNVIRPRCLCSRPCLLSNKIANRGNSWYCHINYSNYSDYYYYYHCLLHCFPCCMFVRATNRMNEGFHNATAQRELLPILRWQPAFCRSTIEEKHIGLLRHWRIAQLKKEIITHNMSVPGTVRILSYILHIPPTTVSASRTSIIYAWAAPRRHTQHDWLTVTTCVMDVTKSYVIVTFLIATPALRYFASASRNFSLYESLLKFALRWHRRTPPSNG